MLDLLDDPDTVDTLLFGDLDDDAEMPSWSWMSTMRGTACSFSSAGTQ